MCLVTIAPVPVIINMLLVLPNVSRIRVEEPVTMVMATQLTQQLSNAILLSNTLHLLHKTGGVAMLGLIPHTSHCSEGVLKPSTC